MIKARWPANLIHSGEEEVVRMFPVTKSAVRAPSGKDDRGREGFVMRRLDDQARGHSDQGSAARFFKTCPIDDEDIEVQRLVYCAKASKADRDSGCDGIEPASAPKMSGGEWVNLDGNNLGNKTIKRSNNHPTVKPLNLIKYLVKLICPPGGTVADFFMGSGSTGKAAMLEDFKFIGVEREPEYFEIACARIKAAQKGQQTLQLEQSA